MEGEPLHQIGLGLFLSENCQYSMQLVKIPIQNVSTVTSDRSLNCFLSCRLNLKHILKKSSSAYGDTVTRAFMMAMVAMIGGYRSALKHREVCVVISQYVTTTFSTFLHIGTSWSTFRFWSVSDLHVYLNCLPTSLSDLVSTGFSSRGPTWRSSLVYCSTSSTFSSSLMDGYIDWQQEKTETYLMKRLSFMKRVR